MRIIRRATPTLRAAISSSSIQRGTGRSEPQLCPELTAKMLQADIAAVAEMTEDHLAQSRVTYLACRDAATGRGIDLNNFGTTMTAEDFDWVRRALGVTQWNVYGESYGTAVAMTLAARHPSTARTLVLDSVYPPDPIPPRPTMLSVPKRPLIRHVACGDRRSHFFRNPRNTEEQKSRYLEQTQTADKVSLFCSRFLFQNRSMITVMLASRPTPKTSPASLPN
jgi:pimeloyl-ACP methyl ester carboxylesterase